jgi:hypothetical protein
MKSINETSTANLERNRQLLMRKRRAIQSELRAVAAEINLRANGVALHNILEKELRAIDTMNLSPADKALVAELEEVNRKHGVQVLKPAGIDSAEAVNGQ